jgi:hypothetical protein
MPQREASKSRQNSHQTATRIEFFHAKKDLIEGEKIGSRGVRAPGRKWHLVDQLLC